MVNAAGARWRRPNAQIALVAMGLLARMYRDYTESLKRLSQARKHIRTLGDRTAILITLSRLDHAARRFGDYALAKTLA